MNINQMYKCVYVCNHVDLICTCMCVYIMCMYVRVVAVYEWK